MTSTGAESWVDYLSAEPRMRNVAAAGGGRLAVTVEQGGGTAIVLYSRDGGEWVATRVIPGASSAIAVGRHGLAYLRAGTICREDGTGLARLPGRIGAMVWCADDERLLVAVQSTVDEPGVAFGTADVSLAAARSGAGPWRLHTVRPDGEVTALPCAAPDGCELTGEIGWLHGGRIVCGLVRALPDGRRRYGLAVWPGDLGEPAQVWLAGHDLTAPVTSPDGRALAVLASTVPAPAAHLDHRPYLVDGADLGVREIPTDPDFWDLPRCWLSDRTLVLLSERRGTRTVVLHDIATGTDRVVPAERSVLAVAPLGEETLATIVSSPASPPELRVEPIGRRPTVVERTGPAPARSTDLGWTTFGIRGLDMAYRMFLPDGRPRGLVVMFHGGPTMSWADWSWRWNPEPLCQLGFAVALLEPPMSAGYGARSQAVGWRAWRTGIAGHAALLVDEVRDRHGLGHAPLIAMGGSFGGYLALHLAALRAVDLVAAHAAPVDLAEVALGCDAYWSWVREYGHPLDEPANYRIQSVDLTAIPTTTRVLLSHGMRDELVPCNESVRSHRILLRRGVPSELTLFRGEGHALRDPAGAAGWYRWVLRACADVPDRLPQTLAS